MTITSDIPLYFSQPTRLGGDLLLGADDKLAFSQSAAFGHYDLHSQPVQDYLTQHGVQIGSENILVPELGHEGFSTSYYPLKVTTITGPCNVQYADMEAALGDQGIVHNTNHWNQWDASDHAFTRQPGWFRGDEAPFSHWHMLHGAEWSEFALMLLVSLSVVVGANYLMGGKLLSSFLPHGKVV